MLETKLAGQKFQFSQVKDLLARASEEKSGDRLAQIGSLSELERVAAKEVLAEVTLAHLRENPVVPYDEDEVTQIGRAHV